MWLAITQLRQNSNIKLQHWWVIVLSAGCIFIAGEEANWGEVYLKYDAGDFIRQANYQDEVSLHNIEIPYIGSYWANSLFKILAICGGLVLPITIKISNSFRRLVWAAEIPLPPWISQAYFFVIALLSVTLTKSNTTHLPRNNIPSEILEFGLSFAIAIWIWSLLQERLKKNSVFMPAQE